MALKAVSYANEVLCCLHRSGVGQGRLVWPRLRICGDFPDVNAERSSVGSGKHAVCATFLQLVVELT